MLLYVKVKITSTKFKKFLNSLGHWRKSVTPLYNETFGVTFVEVHNMYRHDYRHLYFTWVSQVDHWFAHKHSIPEMLFLFLHWVKIWSCLSCLRGGARVLPLTGCRKIFSRGKSTLVPGSELTWTWFHDSRRTSNNTIRRRICREMTYRAGLTPFSPKTRPW